MSETPVYLTADGLAKMKEELEYLKAEKRREVAARIEKAREMGDLRENADYHEAKDESAWVESRILELTDKIRRAAVVDDLKTTDVVSLGSTVRLTSEGKPDKRLTLVGATEADPLAGRISNESPLGLALLGQKAGAAVEVKVPSGIITYLVAEIS